MQEDTAVISIRVSKKFHKQIKQFCLNNDTSVQDVGKDAFVEYLKNHKGEKQ